MAIAQPGPELLHGVPLSFVRRRVTGGARKTTNADIPLVPFIDFLITLVVFLLSSFSASGELPSALVALPTATNATDLELAPVVAIDARVITLDGRRMADTHTIGEASGATRIDALVRDLETLRANWSILHPHEAFPGTIVVQADRATDMRIVRAVMFSAAQAGYADISFAVGRAPRG